MPNIGIGDPEIRLTEYLVSPPIVEEGNLSINHSLGLQKYMFFYIYSSLLITPPLNFIPIISIPIFNSMLTSQKRGLSYSK
jgi:hypothetical protein